MTILPLCTPILFWLHNLIQCGGGNELIKKGKTNMLIFFALTDSTNLISVNKLTKILSLLFQSNLFLLPYKINKRIMYKMNNSKSSF